MSADSLLLPHSENLKHAELKELCRKFHLPLGGNKQVLQQYLQDLSGDRDTWDR